MKTKNRPLFIMLIYLILTNCASIPPALDVDPNTWQIDDIYIHHFDKGEGEPIIMVHGGPGYPFTQPFPGLDPLTEKYRFVYFDQRGCGRSTRPFTRFENGKKGKHIWQLMSTLGYKNHIKDMEAIRQNLGVEKMILLGHSFGAVLSCLYAQQYSDHVKAMILVAPAGLLSSESDVDMFKVMEEKLSPEEAKQFQQFREAYFDFESVIQKSDEELGQLANQFGEFWLKAMDIKDPAVPMADMTLIGGFMHYGIFFSFGKQWDFTPGMKKITAPVLIFHGEKDLQPLSVAESYQTLLPSAELKVIPEASHFPFVETPEEFNHHVEQFLNSL